MFAAHFTHDAKSFQIKKGFKPKYTLFKLYHTEDRNIAIDAKKTEICISEKKKYDRGAYDVVYFKLGAITSRIIRENEYQRTKRGKASYSTKVAGGLVGGLVGTLVADAVGGKEQTYTDAKKITYRISSKDNPNINYNIVLYDENFGLEEDDLRKVCDGYRNALKLHRIISNSN